MTLNKIFIITRVVIPVCLILIASVVMSYSFDAGQRIAADPPDPTTERLFREMSIMSIPNIAPPRDFNLLDLNGKAVSLSDFKGKIVFLNFWTTWCPECRYEMPSMQKLHAYFNDRDFAMVAINMNEPAAVVKRYFREHKLTFTALLDSINELGAPFGIRGIPTTYIIDRDGGIIGKALGSRRWDSKKSIALFEHLVNSVEKNTDTNEHEQKNSTSSNFIKPDISTGYSIADSTYSD
ncbi:MAG: TlpA disulfide reductase family protein [Desulfobacterales bacterium]